MREIFPAFRFHTYRTVFEPFNFSQKTRCQTYRTPSSQKCLISLTSSLLIKMKWPENCPISMKSKSRKNFSQGKCPISLTVLNFIFDITNKVEGKCINLKASNYYQLFITDVKLLYRKTKIDSHNSLITRVCSHENTPDFAKVYFCIGDNLLSNNLSKRFSWASAVN